MPSIQFGVNDMRYKYLAFPSWTRSKKTCKQFFTQFRLNHFFRISIAEATNSLRLSKLVVPSLKYRGESVLLECQYELNNKSIHKNKGYDNDRQYRNNYLYYDEENEEVLYSVKWYKDGDEFYRFVPRANPPQNSYSFDGIKVDVSADAQKFMKARSFKWLKSFLLSTVQEK